MRYKPTGSNTLFPGESRLEKLSRQGDPLERLNQAIDWEYFRKVVEQVQRPKKLTAAGAKPYDPLLMFKVLVLQRYYNLSDDNMEYQILDRLTFCRFLGLSMDDRVPDAKTIWAFREKLIEKELEQELFNQFGALLEKHGLIAHEGKLVDASFVEAPRQRNTRKENEQIKQGREPAHWDETPNKKRQKDTDARWGKKHNQSHYGYKNHSKTDKRHKFMECYATSDASVHDSQALEALLEPSDRGQGLWGDSAYSGAAQRATMKTYRVKDHTHQKGYRNKPLTHEQQSKNHQKSKVRARVEHVFGFMANSMNELKIRTIGLKRAHGIVGLINLTYNLFRYEQVLRIDGIGVSEWK
jgi:IS5 family transposase